jgi:hypothetical protein
VLIWIKVRRAQHHRNLLIHLGFFALEANSEGASRHSFFLASFESVKKTTDAEPSMMWVALVLVQNVRSGLYPQTEAPA